jgi:hypothetical protein
MIPFVQSSGSGIPRRLLAFALRSSLTVYLEYTPWWRNCLLPIGLRHQEHLHPVWRLNLLSSSVAYQSII